MNQIARIIEKHGNTRIAADEISQRCQCSLREAGNLMAPHFTRCKPIYNLRTREVSGQALSNVRISKNWQFCVTNDTLAMFDSPHECYMYLMDGYRAKLLPRSGNGEGRPLTPRALELYERNKKLGFRHWVWIQQGQGVRESTGYDYVYGYGFYTDDGFVIVNTDDTPEFTVVKQ